MANRLHTLFLLLALALVAACNKPSGELCDSEFYSSITVDAQSNAMRAVVNVSFKKDCDWSVRYWKTEAGEKTSVETVTKAAEGESDALLLFLSPQTDYSYQVVVNGVAQSPIRKFRTIERPEDLDDLRIWEKNVDDTLDGYILHTNSSRDGFVSMCDYDGKIVWYDWYGYGSHYAWYNPNNGLICVCASSTEKKDESLFMICADLAGNILYKAQSDETTIPDIHHDLRMLDNGNLLVLSRKPKVYGDIEYWGEMMTEIDHKGTVVFQWDTFRYFNPEDTPYIQYNPAIKDYLHANSVEKDSQGDYYMTLNWLTEIVKIDGKTGELIYRFGPRGNVTLTGQTPSVYSSKQSASQFFTENSGLHCAIALEPDRILCFANGKNEDNSRAAIVKIDPVKKEAHYEMLVDFESNYLSQDRSNVCLLPGNRLLYGAAPWNMDVIADYSGNTIRVISRQYISPRAAYYGREEFYHYLKTE